MLLSGLQGWLLAASAHDFQNLYLLIVLDNAICFLKIQTMNELFHGE